MENTFFAMLSRMRYIERWSLMRNALPENIQERLDNGITFQSLDKANEAVDSYKETGGKEKRPMTAPPPLFFSTAKAPVEAPAEEADVAEEVSEVVEEGAEPAEGPAEAIEEAVDEAPVEAPAEKKPVKGKGKKGAK